MPVIAQTAVSGTAYSFDRLFSYAVPDDMLSVIRCGCRVLVPFGRGDNSRIGIVMKLEEDSSSGSLKYISELADDEPVLSDELLQLACYVRENTFCTYFEAVKAMLPPAMSISVREYYRLAESFNGSDALSDEAEKLYCELKNARSEKAMNELASKAAADGRRRFLRELCR